MKHSYLIHDLTDHPDYRLWQGMKQRCNNPNSDAYINYGARGIKVCESWQKSFPQFLKDMGARPTKGHSLDRIDNGGDYEPSNCKWSTRLEQNRKQRAANKNISGIRGVSFDKATNQWIVYIHVDRHKIHLGRFSDLEDARVVRQAAEAKYWKPFIA